MENQIYQIYDRIFKRIFTLSDLAIINLVNALFRKNHPPESRVVYLNKEFVGGTLMKRFADILLQIDGKTYHLEAQMDKDKSIVIRAFEYGFHYAMESGTEEGILHFPEPVIIYLDTEVTIPEVGYLTLDFGAQGTFQYKVKNFVYQKHELRELNQKKMVILIPFQLLKLRKIIEKEPTPKNFELLRNMVLHDIIGSIKANMDVGNINGDDAQELKELTIQLYEHIYRHYEELGGYQDMKPLLEGAMELPLDKYRMKIDELEEAKANAEAMAVKEQEARIKEQEARIKEQEAREKEQEARIKEQEAREKAEKENQKLRKELEELRNKL